ncbi:HAD hydrolase family protein [Acidisoma silvae]|uniref:HAD hydrolase family protein n=1 Tax=Acidisoma silvae TaxID=2802396 RepID=A0A964DY18_9PROT|nr:HAD hydrolase family protein [Acidisoma silvae]MCB8874637.1 HAD hydrolase family protein [Acidisoma silvae]
MYFLALAADYDGTLAHDGVLAAETLAGLRRFQASGRRVILVTGRQIPDLKAALPDLSVFDHIVAENGALLYDPATGQERLLAPPPPAGFVERLRQLGVTPLSVGRCVVATWEPQEAKVLAAIRDHGLELRIAFNKGAVMVLPPGVSKASGLTEALAELRLSPKNVAGVGDAENDHAFLAMCGCAAAVSNALPPLKETVDIQLTQDHGAGVVELMARIEAEDARLAPLRKHGIAIGTDDAGQAAYLSPAAGHVLLVGPSGSGKSTLATTLTEQMLAQGLSFCVMDPEGDYYELQHAVCVGSAATAPNIHDALTLQQEAQVNLVVNSQALTLSERRRLFDQLITETAGLRETTGRPHWLVLDEAHEMVPAGGTPGRGDMPRGAPGAIFVTMVPESLDVAVLRTIETVLAFGSNPAQFLARFAEITGHALPPDLPHPPPGTLLLWQPKSGDRPIVVQPFPPHQPHHRHIGKYATGDVGAWHSFYFRDLTGRLNRPAHNLYDFIELGEQVDDTIWLHHLHAGDYARWFHDVIRDETLSAEASRIAQDERLSAQDSRRLIKRAIWRRYAAPCERVVATRP